MSDYVPPVYGSVGVGIVESALFARIGVADESCKEVRLNAMNSRKFDRDGMAEAEVE
jgi:hypothetical protein